MALGVNLTALQVSLRPSRRLLCGLLVVHAGALVCLLPLDLPSGVKISLGCLCFASLGYTTADHACRRFKHSIASVICAVDGRWILVTRGGDMITTKLAAGCYVHPQLVVLRFDKAAPWHRRSLALLPDMVAEDVFRRLRVRLRCGVVGADRAAPQ